MIMELPNKAFRIENAKLIGGELIIYNNVRFEDLMYELTYCTKKCVCEYCRKRLTKKTRTIDHVYPRIYGGISIINNLVPTCANCNSDKNDFTHDEYLHYLKLDTIERKKYRKIIRKQRDKILYEKGFILPKKWVSYVPVILIDYKPASNNLRGKRYYRIAEFYHKYKKLPKPVILDKNMRLLDGYNLILFAKDNNIKEVPVIILENVVLM